MNTTQSHLTEPSDDALSLDTQSPVRLSEAQSRDLHSLSRVLVPLMKGVVYQESDAQRWESLLKLQSRVQDHVAALGLELNLDESEGYAFLRTRTVEEYEDEFPRLMAKRALSFPVSLLIALLRKRLVEFDVASGDTRLVLTRTEIVDMLRLFLPNSSNEAKLIDQIDTHIKKIIDLGFLRKMKASSSDEKLERYEVKRIIRAFVDAQWLAAFDERLAEYSAQLNGSTPSADNGQSSTAEQ
jgi:hypothetical protein